MLSMLLVLEIPKKASPIPKRDKEGNVTGYEITEEGETIYTKPNPTFLREITEMVGGTYQHDATGDELKHIFEQVIEKHKNIIGVKKKTIIRDVSFPVFSGRCTGVICTVFYSIKELTINNMNNFMLLCHQAKAPV